MGIDAGGWSWSGRGGGVPNVADTSAVLLALAAWPKDNPRVAGDRALQAARQGVDWLLKLQNADGGWPTCYRGWGKLPLDRSGSDLTAQALRALNAWRRELAAPAGQGSSSWEARLTTAVEGGFRYLAHTQLGDGSWESLWQCDPLHPRKSNRCTGTVAVLAAYRDCGLLTSSVPRRGLDFLASLQQPDGGFGRVEETALVVDLLLSVGGTADHETAVHRTAAQRGLAWLVDAVETNRYQDSSPLGLDFGRLSYRERQYPIALSVAALGRAAQRFRPRTVPRLTAHLEIV
jgi:squalene-hopene/tetraprenyl-beta-curcumene cyclase